jgi:hypothetical protein
MADGERNVVGSGWLRWCVAGFAPATQKAAREVRADLPVTAFPLEHNVASRGTAERAGLQLAWRGPDAGNPDPDAIRLVYTDRPLTHEQIAAMTAHP